MKNFFFLALFFTATIAVAQKSPKASVQQFFDAMHAQDTLRLKKLTEVTTQFQSISKGEKGNNILHTETLKDFLNNISSIPKKMQFKEELGELIIQKDHKMAAVWVPYKFYLDNAFSHCGINLFTLMKKKKIGK